MDAFDRVAQCRTERDHLSRVVNGLDQQRRRGAASTGCQLKPAQLSAQAAQAERVETCNGTSEQGFGHALVEGFGSQGHADELEESSRAGLLGERDLLARDA